MYAAICAHSQELVLDNLRYENISEFEQNCPKDFYHITKSKDPNEK